jgi:hypothetical protein
VRVMKVKYRRPYILASANVRRTGRYKILLVVGAVLASLTYLLLWLRWNGHTNLLDSLYIIPGGLGTGISSTTVFALMTSFLDAEEMATVTGGYILLHTFFMTISVTATNGILGFGFRKQLENHLHEPDSPQVWIFFPLGLLQAATNLRQIIRRAISDINYITHLGGYIQKIVVNCYVTALKNTYGEAYRMPVPIESSNFLL